MSEIDSGGKAFPSHGTMGDVTHEGMTLRQWYAGMALNSLQEDYFRRYGYDGDGYKLLANEAFLMADAMISAGKGGK